MLKIRRNFEKHVIVFICMVLFVVPFFWFHFGEIDLGGDSTRVYFFNPMAWLRNVTIYADNVSNGLGSVNPAFFMIPFSLFLFFLNFIFLGNSYFLNCFFYGLLLSGGFLFTYLSIKEISSCKNVRVKKYSAIIGGLFFVFSPITIYEWQRAGWFIHDILIYPLVFYLFLKFLNYGKYRYLIIGIIVTFIFSLNFSFSTAPWFFAFFPLAFLFLFSYALASKKASLFFKGLILFASLFVLVQFFQLFPQLSDIFSQSSQSHSMIFDNTGKIDRGLDYFLSVQPYVRLIYNLTNQPQYDISVAYGHPQRWIIFNYGVKYIGLFFAYILVVISGGLILKRNGAKKDKIIYVSLLAVFLVVLFLITANINDNAVEFYRNLFSIPGFSMFRSFYTKFNVVFIFFYALLLSISLQYLLVFLKNNLAKKLLLFFLLALITFNAWPLISGTISNEMYWQSKDIQSSIEVSTEFLSFSQDINNKKLDSRYVSFPLTNEAYQVLQGQNGGVYFGPSFLAILTGKRDLSGLSMFHDFSNGIHDALKNNEYTLFGKLLSLMNVGKIIHNSDNYIYDNFPNYPYSRDLKSIFPDQKSIAGYIRNLNYQKNLQVGDKFNLYSARDNFLPHFYVSQNSIVSNRSIADLPGILSGPDWQTRSAIFFSNQNAGKEDLLNKLRTAPSSPQPSPRAGEGATVTAPCADQGGVMSPTLEFKKIDPTKYRIRVHGASGVFPLVFSESFNDGWKTYLEKLAPSSPQPSPRAGEGAIANYKILDGNEGDQATKDELQNYLDNGYVTTLGDGKTRTIEHKRWVDPVKSSADDHGASYVEKYNIDFVSKNFQGTIQNDNLPNGNIFETWFQKPIENNENHLMANGYANSWVIDTNALCAPSSPQPSPRAGEGVARCIKNPDGSYDFEMVVEFWPQRLFYVGLAISLSTLLGCIVYLGYDWRVGRYYQKHRFCNSKNIIWRK